MQICAFESVDTSVKFDFSKALAFPACETATCKVVMLAKDCDLPMPLTISLSVCGPRSRSFRMTNCR